MLHKGHGDRCRPRPDRPSHQACREGALDRAASVPRAFQRHKSACPHPILRAAHRARHGWLIELIRCGRRKSR
jgi:hypothetical protein